MNYHVYVVALLCSLIALSSAGYHSDQSTTPSTCPSGYNYCPDDASCYHPSQYSCTQDPINHDYILCAAGTSPCNGICIADCGYTCQWDGTVVPKAQNTCPATTVCYNGQVACGSECYDPSTTCCVSDCPAWSDYCDVSWVQPWPTSPCPFYVKNVGQLQDGQLRLRYGPGASDVSFTLSNGILKDNSGRTCYLSSNTQLQCGYQTQTNMYTQFSIKGDFLAYGGNVQFYSCDTGTGGANIFSSKVDANCSPQQLKVIYYNCPTTKNPTIAATTSTSQKWVPTTSSTQKWGNPTIAATTSTSQKWVPTTSSTQKWGNPTIAATTSTSQKWVPTTSSTQKWGNPTIAATTSTSQKWVPTTSSANPTIATPTTQPKCPWGSFCLKYVGELPDGQLRYNYQNVALSSRPNDVSFTITNGILQDNHGRTCYFSASSQLQCDLHPQTDNYKSFSVVGNLLSYNGNTGFFSCNVGDGSANLYNSKIDRDCSSLQLWVNNDCCYNS